MKSITHLRSIVTACALAALCTSVHVAAQEQTAQEMQSQRAERSSGLQVQPYIEAAQVLSAELSPGDDVVTYTQLAAGVDAGLAGRNSAASVSLRYERRFGYGRNTSDGDTVSGIARASLAVVPRRLTFEAGGLAARTRVESNGATSLGAFGGDDTSTSQIYALYAGPALQTNVDDLIITGSYLIGYTRVEAPDAAVLALGDEPVDIFDEGVSQSANARAGFAPGTALPIGVGVGGGWNQQDISNLDQRIQDRHVRADVTVPVSRTAALIGGVGYEEVEISSRDAVRDSEGDPVIGPDGRFVTDKSEPRRIAYETDGLIWDVGVMWRPSNRTSMQATVGRRYGSTTYYGSLAYAPNPRTSVNVGVYNNLTGFGGTVIDSLAGLPTDFDAFRNPITGDLAGCVDSTESGNCALSRLGSLRSSIFRSRGITASVARSSGPTSYGIAGGYDRRSFIAAAGTALSAANGIVDENIWMAVYGSQQLDRSSNVSANGTVNWFDSGFDSAGTGMGYSASLAYYRNIIAGLSGTAAVGLDGVTRDDLPDFTTASALVGLRYSF